jgi:Domain of unknown function (DUF4412)
MTRARAAALALAFIAAAACKKGSTKELVTRTFGFEGEVEQETRFLTGMTTRVIYKMKGQKVRVDIGTTVMLADLAAKKSYMLDNTAKTYRTVDWSTLSADAGAAPPARVKTGKKDVVAGHGCDEYEYTTATGDKATSCVTTEIYGPVAMAAGALGAFGDDLGFPLRTVMRNPSGTEVFRSEVVRIDKKTVPEKDVSIPSGYRERP